MHWHRSSTGDLVIALVVALFLGIGVRPAGAAEAALTLERAWQLAEQANPGLGAARANLAAAEGQVTDSRSALWNNPQLLLGGARRSLPRPGQSSCGARDVEVGLAQSFETAGQQGFRREAAGQDLEAVRLGIEETRRQLRGAVEQRFVRVLALQLRIAAEDEGLRLFDDAAAAVRRQADAGEASRLDRNFAQVEAERARNQRAALNEQLTDARAELAAALQMPPDVLPQAVGDLDVLEADLSLEGLLARVAERPLLRSMERREKAARSRLDLERASVYPDVTVGLSSGRQGGVDGAESFMQLSISLPLPLFRRNATGIGRAVTELTQARIESTAVSRDSRALIIALWQKRESLMARVERLEQAMQARLDENRRLSEISRNAGEIGLLQVLLVNRQVLDGRRDLLDARTDLRLATVALKAAAGWPEVMDRR